jgi:hypothetical protein
MDCVRFALDFSDGIYPTSHKYCLGAKKSDPGKEEKK